MKIPDGFSEITPYIFADNAEAYVRFLVDAFDAKEIGRHVGPNGRIANCQVKFATTAVMVSEASADFPASRGSLYLYVGDADLAVARAEKAGAEMVMDVADMPYGDRQGGVRDPFGNIWWISQRLSDGAYF